MAQTVYTHVSKCKNDKIRAEKKIHNRQGQQCALSSQLLQRLRWEDCLSPGVLRPAWATTARPHIKNKIKPQISFTSINDISHTTLLNIYKIFVIKQNLL
jgi:hypothetical protein